MTAKIDIGLSARMLIDQHGAQAAIIAAQGAYEMRERGDTKGEAIWRDIGEAVAEMQADMAARRERTVGAAKT